MECHVGVWVCKGDVRDYMLIYYCTIKLGNDLKTQVETHFTALEEALSARKAVLLQNLNGKIASVGTYK